MIQAAEEQTLLAWVTTQLEQCSRRLHEDTRRRAILRDAATWLRVGRPAPVVRAMLEAFEVDQP